MSNYNENSIDSKITLLLERGMADLKDKEEFRADILARLSRIEDHCEHTNGSIADAQRDIAELKETHAELGQLVTFKNFIQAYIFNKYFLIISAVFAVGLIKVLTNEELRGFLFKLLGI